MISLLLKYIWIQYETTYLKENSETQNQFLTYSILCHTTIILRQGDLSESIIKNNFTFLTLSNSSLLNPFHPNTIVDLLYFHSYTFTHNCCTFKYPSCGSSFDCVANLYLRSTNQIFALFHLKNYHFYHKQLCFFSLLSIKSKL